MKIIIRDTGKEYPRKYKEGKEEYWEKALMKIWRMQLILMEMERHVKEL